MKNFMKKVINKTLKININCLIAFFSLIIIFPFPFYFIDKKLILYLQYIILNIKVKIIIDLFINSKFEKI